MVNLSRGGNASQSSWYELLPENDPFRDNRGPRYGLPGFDASSKGVLLPSGGEDPVEGIEPPARESSGERLLGSGSFAGSDFAPGIGIGSDISDSVRLWAVEEVTPKETRRSIFPPPRTKPSAMTAWIERIYRERGKDGGSLVVCIEVKIKICMILLTVLEVGKIGGPKGSSVEVQQRDQSSRRRLHGADVRSVNK